MTYAKFDDLCPEHPKIAALSDRNFRAWFEMVCYASRNLTDGFLPDSVARRYWGGRLGALVKAGMLEPATESGYMIHDYLDWNDSREAVVARKAQAKAAASARWNMGNDAPSRPPPMQTAIPSTTTTTPRLSDSNSTPREKTLAAPAARARDPIFEALADECGMDWHELTAPERAKINAAVADLRPLKPTYAEIRRRGGRWPEVMGDATKTPKGISTNWARLNGPARAPPRGGSGTDLLQQAQRIRERRGEVERADRRGDGMPGLPGGGVSNPT